MLTISEDHSDQTGYFIFSLDTELALGYFDKDALRSQIFSPDGSRERWSIRNLLEILAAHNIVATWAVVGHMFYRQCEKCAICPILDWKGKYQSFELTYENDHPLFYGADVIELLLSKGQQHEIGFHGYTHEVFSEDSMSREEAQIELQEWLRVSSRYGITPRTLIFPRNKIGHLTLFSPAGFTCYRGKGYSPLLLRNRYFGHYLKPIAHILALAKPPLYRLDDFKEQAGLINIPPSAYLFDFNRDLELRLDKMNRPYLRLKYLVKAIQDAARDNKVIHLYAHPWEFRTEKDLEKLDYLLAHVSAEVQKGRLQSISMADFAQLVRNRWTKPQVEHAIEVSHASPVSQPRVQGLRVLVITNAYPSEKIAGIPSIKNQLDYLKECGVNIDLITIEKSHPLSYLAKAWQIFRLNFQKKRYDLVHAFYGHSGVLARLQFKSPLLVTFLGSDLLGGLDDPMLRKDGIIGRGIANFVDGIITMTEEMKRHVPPSKKVYIIPFGVDTRIFHPQPMEAARAALGLPADEKLILFPWKPSRPEKRYDILEEAISILRQHGWKVSPVVVYHQPHAVMAQYMNACDAIALVSHHEGSPMAIREALACNLPIVSVDVGDVAEAIAGVEGCYLCDPTPEDLAEKLEWVFRANRRAQGAAKIQEMDVAWAAKKVLKVYQDMSAQ